jgi:zinc transporter
MEYSIYSISQKGSFKQIAAEEINSCKDIVWLRTSLDNCPSFVFDLIDDVELGRELFNSRPTRPRAISYNHSLFLYIRDIPPDDKERISYQDSISIRVWVKDNKIITAESSRCSPLDDLLFSIENFNPPKTTQDFIIKLLNLVTDNYLHLVYSIRDRLDAIEDETLDNTDAGNRVEINKIRRSFILLKRYLVPQRDAINKIIENEHGIFDKQKILSLKSSYNKNVKVIEDIDADKARADVINEDILSNAQERLSKRMYILTITAILFMPLGFITGLLGINVGGIPGAHFKYAFAITCIIVIGILAAQIFYLKLRKWV